MTPPSLVVWLDTPDQLFVEVLAQAGVDAVVIDTEHGAFGDDALWRLLGLVNAHGLGAFVRIPELTRNRIMKPLDWGADAVIVPGLHSPNDVELAIRYATYPPMGERGWGPRRVNIHSQARMDHAAHLTREREQRRVWVQIETSEAVATIDDIVATPGLAGVLVGPMDLSGEIGTLGRTNDDAMADAMTRVVRSARDGGVSVGVVEPAASPERLQQRVQAGCTFVSIGTQLDLTLAAVTSRVHAAGHLREDIAGDVS